jgi:7-cyano-7-deazaguanine synthase
MDISFLGEIAWYSALTNPERFPIPSGERDSDIGFGVPITYVPLRNTIFLSLAAAYLESSILKAIEIDGENQNMIEATIFMAPNAIDYSGYPDCRPEFYEKAVDTLNEGSKISQSYGIDFQVQTPIITMSKAEIARLAVQIKAPIHLTWSCYQGMDNPCGTCDSCILRAKGFREAGIKDPALTQ